MLLMLACQTPPAQMAPADALVELDERYTEIMAALGVADRDTARNVGNREARGRKIEHEKARVAFFQDPEVIAAITAARASEDTTVAHKAEDYWRHAVFIRSWTEAEKEQETEILARIEALRSTPASWTSEDGSTEITLNGRWDTVSADADELDVDDRASLAEAWVAFNTSWIGEDLVELVELRNGVAVREGFDDYWQLAIYHRGLEPAEVASMLGAVEALVQPVNLQALEAASAESQRSGLPYTFANDPLLRRRSDQVLDASTTDAWFDADLAEERVVTSFAEMGIPLEGIQVYIGPSRYTRSGAFSFPIRPPAHAAIVVSSDTRWSSWPYLALAHELGLASWWLGLSDAAAASPVLWSPDTPWFEGYGNFFERLVTDDEWLQRYLPELPAEARATLVQDRRRSTISTLTWYLGCTRVEQALYANPHDLVAVARGGAELEKRLRGWPFDAPMAGEMPYTSFLQSALMLDYPGYVQNFVFSAATEALLWQQVGLAVGHPVANPRVGPWLRENVIAQVGPDKGLAERLEELSGGDLVSALKADLEP